MALNQLLAAITAQADQQITLIRQEQERTLKAARDEQEIALSAALRSIDVRKRQKMDQVRMKAEQHAAAFHNNTVLRHKRVLLDRIFTSVIRSLAAATDEAIEPLLKRCLTLAGPGEIRPTERHRKLLQNILPSSCSLGLSVSGEGGFICITEKQEHDFRLETIVQDLLRPVSEILVADTLFSSPSA